MSEFINYEDKLFSKYVERKTRCKAVELRYDNVWELAQFLGETGWKPQVSWTEEGVTLAAQRGDAAFIAHVERGDALILNGYCDVQMVNGRDFRHAWEKEL